MMRNTTIMLLSAICLAGSAAQAMGAIYNGTDASAPLLDLTGMTFTCTIPTGWESNSYDAGKTGAALSTSNFLDGNKNHLNNNTQALNLKAPIGAGSHWNSNAILSATWTMDLGSVFEIHDMTMYAGVGNNYWGMLSTVVQVSTDGNTWTQVGSTAGVRNVTGTFASTTDPWVQDANIVAGATGRYVRIIASDMKNSGNLKLDEFDLFVTAVPEAASLGFLAVGAIGLMARNRRN